MPASIPFFDLKQQTLGMKSELDGAWRRILDSSRFVLGDELAAFEERFARFTGVRYAVGVSTGLDALSLALRAVGVGPGDEVVVPAFTFVATALAVSSVGANPVFADVDPENLLLDAENLERALTRRTRAVIPVHLYGQPAPMDGISAVARRRGLFVIEDAAQAHGAVSSGRRCGSLGDLAGFSFYPSKNIGAFGDGGMITTASGPHYRKLLRLRNCGGIVKYRHDILGFNHRLDNLQAAILDVKLKRLAEWNRRRERLARRYDERLSALAGVRLLKARPGFRSAHHLYVIRCQERDALQKHLERSGVGTGIHYPAPLHFLPVYRKRGYRRGDFPAAEEAARTVLSLPLYPEMVLERADRVAEAVRVFFARRRTAS